MSLIEFPDVIQGSDEWYEQRRGLVTASVVGKLVTKRSLTGINYECPDCGARPDAPCVSKVRRSGEVATPIKSLHPGRAEVARRSDAPPVLDVARGDEATTLTLQLVAERIAGYIDPTYVGDDMLRGIEEEPRARDLYAEFYRRPVREIGFLLREEATWKLGYSPDGLVGDDGLIEIKAPRAKTHLRTILSGEVPDQYMAQCQAGLLVSGREWLDFISFSGGMPMWHTRVLPDPAWQEAIVAAVEQFEATAAEMVEEYQAKTAGLPPTERIPYMEMKI
ncbi:lambda exonuclease family protein [Amycolatopsis thermoflava]|uniref:lambda exonuclease family protein n=1 Tax=Amycolatopsis thermoflava TaxID=84480 RepID=UPI003F4A6B38